MAHDFIKILKQDHDRIKDVLKELEDKTDRELSSREELFVRLKQELIPHMEAEDRVFYPALRNVPGPKKDILESIEEHHVGRMVLDELSGLSRSAPNWKAKLIVFKELLEHHIEVEEDKVFDMARDSLTDEQLTTIMRRFQEEKEKAMVRVA